jgi:hypothetical protein
MSNKFKGNNKDSEIQCNNCRKTFTSSRQLTFHIKKCFAKPIGHFDCPYCGMAFVNANHKAFLKHLNDYHRKNMPGLYEYDNTDTDVGDLLDNSPLAAASNIAKSTRSHKRKFIKMKQLMKRVSIISDCKNCVKF